MFLKGRGETTELTEETRALMPPQVLAAMKDYLEGASQLQDLDLIRIPENEIEDLLSLGINDGEAESLFQPPTPNLGNVFVDSSGPVPPPSKAPATNGVVFADRSQNLLFIGGDPHTAT